MKAAQCFTALVCIAYDSTLLTQILRTERLNSGQIKLSVQKSALVRKQVYLQNRLEVNSNCITLQLSTSPNTKLTFSISIN